MTPAQKLELLALRAAELFPDGAWLVAAAVDGAVYTRAQVPDELTRQTIGSILSTWRRREGLVITTVSVPADVPKPPQPPIEVPHG